MPLAPATIYRLQCVGAAGAAIMAVGVPTVIGLTRGDLPWLCLAGAVALAVLLLCWTYRANVDWPGASVRHAPASTTGAGRIALTFDDGPSARATELVLDVLAAHRARASFFCVGSRAAAHPELVARMVREGHLVGNHTQDHRRLAWLSRAEIERQIDEAQLSLVAAGASRSQWFRAPHGFKSIWLPGVLRARGMRLVAWSHDLRDFERPGVDVIVERARKSLSDGAIMLLHDGGGDRDQTASALDAILRECRRRGLEPVTVAELCTVQAEQSVIGVKDSRRVVAGD